MLIVQRLVPVCLALFALFPFTWERAEAITVTYNGTIVEVESPMELREHVLIDPHESFCDWGGIHCLVASPVDPLTGEIPPPGSTFPVTLTLLATNSEAITFNDGPHGICETEPNIYADCLEPNFSSPSASCAGKSLSIDDAVTATAFIDPPESRKDAALGLRGYLTDVYLEDDVCMSETNDAFTILILLDKDYIDAMGQAESWGGPGDNPDTVFDGGGTGTCSAQGLPRYYVNTAALNLVIEDADFVWTSFGHEAALRRVWNQISRTGMFGAGWSFAFESTLSAKAYDAGGASVRLGSGQLLSYAVDSVTGAGSGAVTAVYASQNAGRRPLLTATLSEATRTGVYSLYDKVKKITSTYAYSGVDLATGEFLYRLSSIADKNGNALTLAYDGDGHLASLTDASGRAVTFAYNEAGLCSGFTVFSGQSASFTYDAGGHLIQSVDLAGNVTAYAYDADHAITSMTSAGKTTGFSYATVHGLKRVVSVTDAQSRTTAYAMDDAYEVTVTGPGGATRLYAHDKGATTRVEGLPGGTVQTAYDAHGLPVSVTREGGAVTSFEYDENGNMTRRTGPTGGVTSFAYDANWNMTSATDALGHVWRFAYDAKNNLVSRTTPLNRVTAYSYDAKGDLTRITHPGGGQTNMTHDAHGNLLTLSDPTGKTTTLTYDDRGLNIWKSQDPRGNERSYVFDANRRLTRTNLPNATAMQYGYDCCALSSVTNPAGYETTVGRDALLRMTGLTDPLGRSTAYAYDADGNLASIADPLGRTTAFAYDGTGRLASVTSPLGAVTSFSYNARGGLASLTTPTGQSSLFDYDQADRLTRTTDSLGESTGLTLDALGRETVKTNARGQTVSFVRDADGRITAKKYANEVVASFVWSDAGFLSSVTDGAGTTLFTRDAAGRITAIRYPDGKTLELSYDAAGNLASLTYPGGLTVTYVYDSLNRPTRASFAGRTIDLAYDVSGNLATETHSNGVTSRYSYDAAGRLTGVSHKKGTAVIADLAYTRNAAGEITRESGTWPLYPAFHSDADTASYDSAGRVASWQGDLFSYDADGGLTSISGARSVSAVYDPENRATALTMGGVTREYLFDGLGRRVRITAGSMTRNLHDDPEGRLAFETDARGNVTVCYVYAGPFLVAQGTPTGGFARLLRDKTASILALTGDSGDVTAAYAYGDYGQPAGKTGSAETSFTYVGALGVMDEGDGIHFMKHRLYDAATGRFFQRDPVLFGGGDFNLYRYARSAPISRVDPSGLADFEMNDWGYGSGVAEGTFDPVTGAKPHMADPVSYNDVYDFMATVDIAASAAPGPAGRAYVTAKSACILVAGGGLNSVGVADDILWEFGKMLSGPAGTIADFFDLEAGVNAARAKETQEQLLKGPQWRPKHYSGGAR